MGMGERETESSISHIMHQYFNMSVMRGEADLT